IIHPHNYQKNKKKKPQLIVRYFPLSHALFISLLATPFFRCTSFPHSGLEVLRGGLGAVIEPFPQNRTANNQY
ncbi:MAG: hypothetical protein ACPGQC_14975, partial [Limisphaerales bacterium]